MPDKEEITGDPRPRMSNPFKDQALYDMARLLHIMYLDFEDAVVEIHRSSTKAEFNVVMNKYKLYDRNSILLKGEDDGKIHEGR